MRSSSPEQSRRKRVADAKTAILQAATRLFAERGYDITTTRMIAREAGVAEGTIYLYFPSKRHILLSLIRQASVPVVTSQLADTEGQSDESVLRVLFTERIRFGREYAPLLKTLLSEAMHDADLAQQLLQEVIQPLSALVKEYIEKRIEEGVFREAPADIAARVLVGMFWFTIVYDHLLACDPAAKAEVLGSYTPEEYAQWFANLVLGGIAR
ncbi:MAG: TetR/AcrR family transcriptional regulator [bacterium]|nr:TetR/AcrR family transcriptional regulator [bacterium]